MRAANLFYSQDDSATQRVSASTFFAPENPIVGEINIEVEGSLAGWLFVELSPDGGYSWVTAPGFRQNRSGTVTVPEGSFHGIRARLQGNVDKPITVTARFE